MSENFTKPAIERLKDFLHKNKQNEQIQQLTPDASTREYFRVSWKNKSAIACIYQENFDETLPQIDVTNLFLKSNLPVAEIFIIDYKLGIVLHEDFGDTILRDVIENSDFEKKEELLNQAIKLIAQIQKSTNIAHEFNSIASKLKFDEEKLLWELNFFKEHYFESLINKPLTKNENDLLTEEFKELSKELEDYAKVLTHRDFHAANLMVSENEDLKIIDHQDARLGSVAYDLVSLLLDRITELPSQDLLRIKKEYFLLEREKLGLEKIKIENFDYEFELMTIQRCLKAIGTFSNQAGNLGKKRFVKYINPMFQVVLNSCKTLQRFQILQRQISKILQN